jgi:uncharacterized protein (DUF2147 family)
MPGRPVGWPYQEAVMQSLRCRYFALATLVVAGALASSVALAESDPKSPIGRWRTLDENKEAKSIIRIWEKDGKVFGTIEELLRKPGEEPNPLCTKCEGELKDKPVKGMVVITDLKRDGDEYSGGHVVDPDNGKSYKCFIEVVEGGKRLKVRGYIGFALLGRTQYWERAE